MGTVSTPSPSVFRVSKLVVDQRVLPGDKPSVPRLDHFSLGQLLLHRLARCLHGVARDQRLDNNQAQVVIVLDGDPYLSSLVVTAVLGARNFDGFTSVRLARPIEGSNQFRVLDFSSLSSACVHMVNTVLHGADTRETIEADEFDPPLHEAGAGSQHQVAVATA